MIDQEVVEQLRLSMLGFRPVYPVLRDARTGEILAGRHRKEAGWSKVQDVDVDQYAAEWGVPHDVAAEKIRSSLNIQRGVPKEETAESLTRAGTALLKAGVQRSEIVKKLAEFFPWFKDSYIRNLLPPELKDEAKAESGKLGAGKKAGMRRSVEKEGFPAHPDVSKNDTLSDDERVDTTGAVKKQPYARGFSNTMSQVTRKADTPSENELQRLIASTHVPAQYNPPIEIEGELRANGGAKAYRPDALLDGWLILEAEGAGSGSAENPKREAYLQGKGYRILHLPNRFIHQYPGVLAQVITLLHELRSSPQAHDAVNITAANRQQ